MLLNNFYAQLFGVLFLTVSLVMLVRRTTMLKLINEVMDTHVVLFVAAIISLIGGLIVVITHNVWKGGLLTILITLIGWSLIIRAILILFLPTRDLRKVFTFFKPEQHYYVLTLALLVLGAYLTYRGFLGT